MVYDIESSSTADSPAGGSPTAARPGGRSALESLWHEGAAAMNCMQSLSCIASQDQKPSDLRCCCDWFNWLCNAVLSACLFTRM